MSIASMTVKLTARTIQSAISQVVSALPASPAQNINPARLKVFWAPGSARRWLNFCLEIEACQLA
jgi:hypothetical protein